MGRNRKTGHGLPPRVYFRHGQHFYAHPSGKWEALGADPVTASQRALELTGGKLSVAMLRPYMGRIYARAKERAKRRGLEFSLTWAELLTIYIRAKGRCEVTCLPFQFASVGDRKRRAFAPSLDRRDCAKGYTAENCRLVCVAVNIAMNEWGEDLLRTVATALLKERNEPPKYWTVSNITAVDPQKEISSAA